MDTPISQMQCDPTYELLRLDSHEFRLVTIEPQDPAQPNLIRCQLRNASLNNTRPPYKALSYMWGDSKDTDLILVNGNEIHKTKNLVSALKHLRKAQTVQALWIDALCIDQGNIAEKNQQVPLMGKIYSDAAEVIVWLGDPAEDAPLAISFLRDWVNAAVNAVENGADQVHDSTSRFQDRVQHLLLDEKPLQRALFVFPDDPFDTTKWTALNRLLVHKYWTRVWIVQEVILAENVQCYWGETHFEFTAFLSFATVFEKLQQMSSEFFDNNEDRSKMLQMYAWNNTLTEPLRALSSLYKLKAIQNTNIALSTIVSYTVESQATDPRDKIYGLLSLAQPGRSIIRADYNLTTAQVFTRFVLSDITNSRGLCVCLTGHGLRYRVTPDLPSWVPDLQICQKGKSWSSNAALAKEFIASGNLKFSGNVSKDHRQLQVNGIRGTLITNVITRQDKEEFQIVLARCYYALSKRFEELPSRLSPIETLFRTFVQDSSGTGPPNHNFKSEEHARMLQEKLIMFATFLELHKSSNSQAVEEHRLPDMDGFLHQCIPAAVKAPPGFQMNLNLLSSIQGRELDWNDFFVSADGYIGLGTGGIRSGDIICVLSGLHVPAILRPLNDDYILVGDCYCYGMMNGELTRNLRNGRSRLETFSLI